MKIPQEHIDMVHRQVKRVFEVSVGLLFALGITLLIEPLLAKLGLVIANYSWYTIIAAIYKYTAIVLGIIAVASMALTLVLSLWASDDEKQQRKDEIKEILHEVKEEEKAMNKVKTATQKEVDSPLRGLTEQQEKVVLDVLFDIPVNDKGFIANAELMGLIHALDLDDNLKKNVKLEDVIAWVEYIRFPDKVDAAHFKSEYSYRPSPSTVTKMGNRVRKGFEKLANLR